MESDSSQGASGTEPPCPGSKPVVCHLIERLPIGGAETVVYRLSGAQRGGAYEPVVFCLDGGPLEAQLAAEGIRVVNFAAPRPSIRRPAKFLVYLARLLRALSASLGAHRVALIHAHLPDGILLGAAVGALSRTPVVAMYHGLAIFPEGRPWFDPRNRLREMVYRLAGRISARTLVVSPAVAELLSQKLKIARERIEVVPNGIDCDRFAGATAPAGLRRELGLSEDRRVIVAVGRLVGNKGHAFLLAAMPEVAERFPTAALVLVGDGPAKEDLRALAREVGVEERVTFAGARSDVAEILALAEVFAHPSLFEGIPLSVIEAMAAAKPIVLTRVPGNVDVVPDERFGVIVPPEDSPALAEGICVLLADRERALALGRRAQVRARREFGLERFAARVEAVYDDVIHRGRSSDGSAGET